MDLALKNLPGFLEQIHTFLVNNEKSYIFPTLTMAMEDILADIAKDTSNLKKYDDVDCKIWSKRILEVLEKNKEIYTLSYCFENVLGQKVMEYKKIPVPGVFKEPLGLKLLRKPHSHNGQPVPSTDNANAVMSSFKTTCLNATLKFVKNDNQLVLQYPDISTEQADFIKHMISQCLSPKNFSTTPGGRGIFDPLAEALRIYSTKYYFKLNNAVPVKDDMKRLIFEKTLVKNAVAKDLDTLSISSISSQDSVECHQNFTQLIQALDNNFTRKTIADIKEFLMNKDEEIEFTNLAMPQEEFLVQWKSVFISSEVSKLFGDDVQDDLRKIKSLLMECKGVCKIETSLQNASPTQGTVFLRKKWTQDIRHQKDQIQVNPENKPIAKSTPKIKIEIENHITVFNTTTNLNTTKKAINPLLKPKIAMTFSTFSDTMKDRTVNSNEDTETVTKKMPGTIPKTKMKVEKYFLYDNTTINSMPNFIMNLDPKPFVKVNTETVEVNNDTPLNSTPVIKVNNSSNSSSTEKTKTYTEFSKIFHNSNENTKAFININSEVPEENNNTTENSSTAKVNATKNSSVAKVNTTLDSFIAIVNTTENSSIAKVDATENSSIAKVDTTENSSIAKVDASKNSSVAKVDATENSSIAKLNTTDNSSIAKVNATENSSIAKVNTTDNSSIAKVNATVDSCNKASMNSTHTGVNLDKTNDVNDFIVPMSEKEIIQNKPLPKKGKQLLALKTALRTANGQFIEDAITQLRDFIASSNRYIETLNFTELSKAEQEIILNWEDLINRCGINCMFCVRGQMILDEIRTLLENGRKIFNVAISSKTVLPTNRTVTFTKKRKQNPAANLDYPDLLSNCKLRSSPEKMDKRLQKFFNATNSLSEKWIEKSLKQLNDFIQDDAQARLVIPNAKDSQVAFLSKWKTFLGMKDVIEFYNTDIQRLLIDIKTNMAEKKAPWRVVCSNSRRKLDFTRDVTFMKYPDYDDNTRSQVPTKTAPKVDTKKAEIAPKSNKSKVEISTKVVEPVKSDKGIPKSSSVTSLPVQKVPVLSERGRPKSATVTPSLKQAKANLIQALSQPLVSEKGIKMMKSMGWDGGALGLRGEGIVEPIALPLDLKKGAGLGCEKVQIKRSKLPLTDIPVMTNLPVNISRVIPPSNLSKMDFKVGILQTILNMVLEATPATELPFKKTLTQKNWSFIKHSVISFNEGTKYMHDVPILRDLGLRIVDKLSKNNCIITACWGVSKTNVLFVLSKEVYEPCDLDSNKWCSVVNFDKPEIPDNVSETHSNVIVAGDTFRYYVLAQIMQFCDRPGIDKVPAKTSLTKEIVLKGEMKQKQMAYIKDLISRLNNKSRASSDADSETALFNDIKDAMKGFILDVDFPFFKGANENKKPVYNTIRFHKILNTPKTSKQNTPTHTAKVTSKNTKRRTTFTSDTFDEKCMFDSHNLIYDQNAPISERDVPKIVQDEPIIDLDAPIYADALKVAQDPKHDNNEPKIHQDTPIPKCAQDPKHDQNELKHDNDALKYEQDAPKIVQDALEPDHNPQNHKQVAQDPKHDHNEPKIHQDTPIFTQDVPKSAQDPKHDQNELKNDNDALKYDQDAPKIVQDALEPDHDPQNHRQNAQKIVRNEPNVVQTAPKIVQDAPIVGHVPKRYTPTNLTNLIDGVDCMTDDKKINEENDVVKAVEYIFIEKETVKSDIGGPIVTVTKDNEVTSNMTEDLNKKLTTIANLDDGIKNLSINDNIDEITENLVGRPKETIYGLDLENTDSEIQNIIKDKNLCKRPISISSTPDRACKKGRYEHYFKKIIITPKNYPQNEITNEVAAKIQKSILGSIDYTDDLPLLQCHGIEDGALVYSCHTEKSLNFILNVIKSLDLLVTASQEAEVICHRMTVKIRSFIKESVDVIFDRLETYNINLDTRNWKVIDIERGRDVVIICMDVDENSYNMLYREKFTLYTGIDQAKFSMLWD